MLETAAGVFLGLLAFGVCATVLFLIWQAWLGDDDDDWPACQVCGGDVRPVCQKCGRVHERP